ncbi:response regulator [Ramlibacter albus]|uniref:Response regulator transcription factor n=1 Tax=Ramlibacter albus TaxID=2079448 RepID=A0A923MEQ9_9BURK|nr:response regulator transcription factor [Ramlibacter albus]MBC5767657.1 response regulator transcription factor [Ramlibacter albus]
MPIRILVADDHAIFREGVQRIIGRAPGLEIVGEACDGVQAVELARRLDFDLLVTDLSMPGKGGMEVIKAVRADKPQAKVLVLSMHAETEYAVRAIKAGASGYLTKESAGDQLVQAIHKVMAGGASISSEVAEQLALSAMGGEQFPHESLTEREWQIFTLLVAGWSVNEAGRELHLSPKTVSSHKSNVMQKVGVSTQTDLVRYALKHGLAEPLDV